MSGAALGSQIATDGGSGAVQIFLGAAQSAMPVDWPGQIGTDVGVGHGLGAVSQHAGITQGSHPQLPILTAHHCDGVLDLFLVRRLDGGGDDLVLVGIDGGGGVDLTDRFEGRAHHFAGFRHLAHRRGQGVDNQINLTQILLDKLDHLGAALVGEGIAVDALGVEARLFGCLVEGGRVVPASGTGLGLGARFFKEDAEGGGAATEGSRNPGGQAITGGSADHQHLLGAILDGALGLGISDLATNIGFTTDRMSGGADKAANLGFDDHMGSRIRLMDEIGA